MKLINKLFLGLCAFSLLTLASCNKDDDGGPSTPANPGVFKGSFINPQDGSTNEWNATSTKAVHDTTLFGDLTITAKNAAGDLVTILLSDTAVGGYTLFQNTFNESSYESTTLAAVATTRTNDVPTATGPSQSTIEITDGGKKDGRVKGIIHVLQWYIVGDGTADDTKVAILSSGTFDIPLTRVGYTGGSGDMAITAKIDGTPFVTTTVMSSGFMLTGIGANNQSLIISLPNNSTTGSHDVGGSSQYSVTYSDGVNAYLSEGTMNITTFNSAAGTATGTFDVTATQMGGSNSVSITEGTFSF